MADEEQETIDEFQRVKPIAMGNVSEIVEVSDPNSGEHYAVKILREDAFESSEEKATLKHEGKIGAALDHPNFVKVHRTVVNKHHAYILMDYFRAPHLKNQLVSDIVGVNARFGRLFEQLCLSLAYMHEKGWIHKDIKPENILFNKASEMRLIDFSLTVRAPSGLSKLMGGKVKSVQGTRTYIAPETIRKQQATIATDIYSLGIVTFEVLTGSVPFRGSSPNDLLRAHIERKPPKVSDINKNVTPELDRLVERMLLKKPADRHADMNELYAEFRSLKPFIDDVEELAARESKAAAAAELDTLAGSQALDSREDHRRSELGLEPERKSTRRAAAKRPAPEPEPAPQPPQQPMPNYPGMPPQGFPGYPPGYMPMPQQPMPPQPMPYPMPPYPNQPGQAPNQQPAAGPPQQSPPQQSAPPQQQPAPEPPPQKEKEKEPEPPADLDFMDELPDVI